jgi:ParB/RepB/Spo0J family partition protein
MAQAIFIKEAKMTTTDGQSGTRALSIEELKVSTTAGQTERRKHFNKVELDELAKSIKTVGVLSPILARPVNGRFEIVFGERRFIAAKLAGLTAIDVTVRTLSDEQVLEVQLVENLQREGLHELAEAEGYGQLIKLGHNADEIAEKVGKSRGYIYARMKLLALCADARNAFYEGKFPPSSALLLARIPMPVQLEALREIISNPYDDAPMSFREVKRLIHETYMLRLSDAGFPTTDATLITAAGACSTCPKRTGNQPELFDDVKSKDLCTDPMCFKAKRQANAARGIAAAKDSGQEVITGKDAKKVMPWNHGQLADGFKKLTDKCYDDKKQRTWGQLLGKDFVPTLVQDPESGVLVKVVPPAAVKEALQFAGVAQQRTSSSNPQSAAEKKAKIEKKFRAALYAEMRDKFPAELGQGDLKTIALRFYDEMQQETQKQILGLWQWEPLKRKGGYGLDCHKPAADGIAGFDDAQIARFFFDLVFVKDLQVHTYSDDKPTLLLTTAKKLKVDAERIRRQLNAASIPKAKKKAKAKK